MLTRSYVSPSLSLFDTMDRLFPRVASIPSAEVKRAAEASSCPVNVAQDDEKFYVQALVPGATAETVELTTQGNAITISGEMTPVTPEGASALWSEIRPYKFKRVIQLPGSIDPNQVDAKLENGILTVTAAKSDYERARTIKIASSAQ